MPIGTLNIATCQFAVGPSIKRNSRRIQDFIRRAHQAGADIVHFSECALSGYAGRDFETLNGFDWDLLRKETQDIIALAGRLGIWLVLPSMHRLTESNKPHNCQYLVTAEGKIADRYDKRFCTTEDLNHYTPGSRFVFFTLNGVKCALLICFDLRFPEIYRALYRQGADCVLQSFYNARQKGPSLHEHIIRQTMQCRAATNHFWVSLANSSGYYSPYASCFIQPDGVIVNQLRRNRAGMMINTVDLKKEFYDPMAPFRDAAAAGALDNAPKTIQDPRSKNTTSL